MRHFWNKNIFLFSFVGAIFFFTVSFLRDVLGTDRSLLNLSLPVFMGTFSGAIIGLMKANLDANKKEAQQFLVNIIETLANSLDERDKYTHGHARRVTNLAMSLGNEVGLKHKELELLRLGAILHDIGKIGVPDSILLKPEKLSDQELEIIKQHPAQGEHILKPMNRNPNVSTLIRIVRHHHERYDGAGYPDGLTGEKIPLLARIIAIADSFDAMTSDRPYRKGMQKEKVLSEIQNGAGTQYDFHLATKFVSIMQMFGESECPSLQECDIFSLIKKNDVSNAYNAQFCHGLYLSCARYQIKLRKNRPTNLLPDGGYLQN